MRQGQDVKLKARMVTIDSIEIVSFSWPEVEVSVVCSKGVYIRSLARDLGKCLKAGGYLSSLVRTKVGQYSLVDSIDLEKLKIADNGLELVEKSIKPI